MAAANIDGITNYSADRLSLSEGQMQKTDDGGGSLRFAFVIRFGAVAAVSRTRRETGSICIEMMVHAF